MTSLQTNDTGTKDIPFSASLLKSAIQKAVRRGNVDAALSCTKNLLDKDPRAALRRLMIIILEESIIHPDYAKLAVLTDRARQRGMELTEQDKTLVLTIVADITRCEWRDFDKQNPDYVEGYKIAKLEDDELALINAIGYRVRIGGWQDDMKMCRDYSRIWSKRFGEGSWNLDKLRSYFTSETAEYGDIAYAGIDDIPLEAVDFHSSPVNKILIKKPYVVEMIRKAMPPETRAWAGEWRTDLDILNKITWCLRSGVNYKKVLWTNEPVNWLSADKIPREHWDDFNTIYQKIVGELDNLGYWFLNKVNEQ